jgi:hypothetical protein
MTTSQLLRPGDLQKISGDVENVRIQEHLTQKEKEKREQQDLRDAFMAREINPEVMDRVNAVIRTAAEQGLHEVQALTFPASYCNDRGRRINNLEADWPDSLEGFAKRAFDFYSKELKPLGFKLRAQILTYPGGTPGEVGIFLSW